MPDTPAEREGQAIWSRLRRRKVVQWGIAYVAVAWGFLQGLEYAGNAFGWPGQIRQIAILALLIGLPIVVTVAWYHGDRGEQRVKSTELAIIVLLLLVGGGIFWRYDRASESSIETNEASAAPAAPTTRGDARPSIAVLPFENRSRIAEDAFFVDGIHDDILIHLSKVSALKVISRTSVEQFRETRLPMKSIADQLGVTRILVGGVQRAGDRVRVNVQLIDAVTDEHVWAESYDRKLTAADIFAIQSELAAAISSELKATLTPAERTRTRAHPTQSLEAWEAYQLGRQRIEKRTTVSLAEAEKFFQSAIASDPKFALAHAGLSKALDLQMTYSGVSTETSLRRSDEAAQRALHLDPNSAEAWTQAAEVAWRSSEVDRAEQMLRRAIELNPNSATAHHVMCQLLLDARGRPHDALSHAEQARELDPLSAIINTHRARVLYSLGRFEDAMSGHAKAIRIDPSLPVPYADVGIMLAYGSGRTDRAIPWLEKAASLDPANPRTLTLLSIYYGRLGEDAEARRWLDRALARESAWAYETAAIESLVRGDKQAARRYARQAAAVDPLAIVLLPDEDLRSGDHATATARYAKAYPELLGTGAPEVAAHNLGAAVDLALVLQHAGKTDRAKTLLDRAEAFIRQFPRGSADGHRVGRYEDEFIRILALRNAKTEALARLRENGSAGWWGIVEYHRDLDPSFASIRSEPEFKAIFGEIAREMAEQRARLAARRKDAPLDLALQ